MKKLSRADRKQIEAAIARANRTDKKNNRLRTVSPMNGCGRTASAVWQAAATQRPSNSQDINYQLSQNEDKTAIFEGWCDFLNYFDSSIQFQLSFFEPGSL